MKLKTIESQLDRFFAQLQHTPGPWVWEDEYIRAHALDVTDEGNMIADVRLGTTNEELTMPANIQIICSAPSMLRTICRTYLWMLSELTYERNSGVRVSASCQATLADLCGTIATATGIDHQEVNETFEAYALELRGFLYWKTPLPDSITTKEEAIAFLTELCKNNEQFEGNAFNIYWGGVPHQPDRTIKEHLNNLMHEIDALGIDPCDVYLELQR